MFFHSTSQFDAIRRETDGEPKHHKAFKNFHFQFSHFPTDIIYNPCPAGRPALSNMDSPDDDDDAQREPKCYSYPDTRTGKVNSALPLSDQSEKRARVQPRK